VVVLVARSLALEDLLSFVSPLLEELGRARAGELVLIEDPG
jgi:hypothetical protein